MDHHQHLPSPVNNDSTNSLPSPSEITLPDSLFPNHSSRFHSDSTLEDSLARLRVSSYNNHSLLYPSFLNSAPHGGATGRGFPMGPMHDNNLAVHNLDWNNGGVTSVGGMRPQNYWVGSDSWGFENFRSSSFPTSDATKFSSNYGWFLRSRFARQQEIETSSSTAPLSNEHELRYNSLQNFGGFYSRNKSNLSKFLINGSHHHWSPQSSSHQSLADLRGTIPLSAKDQYGCRLLQEMMTGLKAEEISVIFSELIDHMSELMLDPFGNYVVQKLVEVCTEEQRTQIILMATQADFQLVNICLNMHGTRVVQKLLEHVTTQNQRAIIISALTHCAVALTKDMNGHHVILHCLKHFSTEDNKHLLNEVGNHCFEIATHKSGCCVLQQCVNYAKGEMKDRLMSEIVRHVLELAEDCYGNYVVQHLISLKIAVITESILKGLQGSFVLLSCNKYGSNVVEKILLESGEEYSTRIILELLQDKYVSMLLVDPFGNYVIKSALMVSKGHIHDALLMLIGRNSSMMRSNLYGKKLLARFDRAKLRSM